MWNENIQEHYDHTVLSKDDASEEFLIKFKFYSDWDVQFISSLVHQEFELTLFPLITPRLALIVLFSFVDDNYMFLFSIRFRG